MVTTLSGELTDADIEAYCADFEQSVLARRRRFASLVNTTRMTAAPTARQRKALADWQTATQEIGNLYNVGIAMVLSSGLIRGALTAMNWLFPPKVKTEVFSTEAEANAYLTRVLATFDLAPGPAVEQRRQA